MEKKLEIKLPFFNYLSFPQSKFYIYAKLYDFNGNICGPEKVALLHKNLYSDIITLGTIKYDDVNDLDKNNKIEVFVFDQSDSVYVRSFNTYTEQFSIRKYLNDLKGKASFRVKVIDYRLPSAPNPPTSHPEYAGKVIVDGGYPALEEGDEVFQVSQV